ARIFPAVLRSARELRSTVTRDSWVNLDSSTRERSMGADAGYSYLPAPTARRAVRHRGAIASLSGVTSWCGGRYGAGVNAECVSGLSEFSPKVVVTTVQS